MNIKQAFWTLGLLLWTTGVWAATPPTFTQGTAPSGLATGFPTDYGVAPAFVDIDNDGDQDAFVGIKNGTILFYRNIGTATAPSFVQVTGSGNPFNGLDVGSEATLTFMDVNGDGLKDALIGRGDGNHALRYFRNVGTLSTPAFTEVTTGLTNYPFITTYSARIVPAVGDVNNDGLLDVVVAIDNTQNGAICTNCRFRYFQNMGGNVWVEQKGAANPFANLKPSRPSITFGDVNGDGKTDFVLGNSNGQLLYYQNTSATTSPVFGLQTNPFSPSNSVTRRANPVLVDLNGDGSLDVLAGYSSKDNTLKSGIKFFPNKPPPQQSIDSPNAVDVGNDYLRGDIWTKISGTPFSLDIWVYDPILQLPLITYNNPVRLEIMDAFDDTGSYLPLGNCRSTWVSKQTIGTYPAGPAVWSNGRMTVSGIQYNNVLRRARIRITDTITGKNGCSYDAFAIRPAYIHLINVTDGNSTTGGTGRTLMNNSSPTSSIYHVASQPFTVQVDARNSLGTIVTNYTDVPEIDAISLVADGNSLGTATGSGVPAISGVMRDDFVMYDEVGAFVISVTAPDYAAFTDGPGRDGTPLSQMIVPSDATPIVGRFIPDSFEMTQAIANFSSACSGFTYLGQPFGFLSPPTITLTPLNAEGSYVDNYVGNRVRLTATEMTATPSYSINTGTLNILGGRTKSVTANADGTLSLIYDNGQSFSITRPNAVLVPSNREIAFSLNTVADKDGAEIDPLAVPVTIGTTALGGGIPFDVSGTGNGFRYGQMRLVAASGPNSSPLDVPLLVEYWTTGAAFATATDDVCTTGVGPYPVITAAQVTLNKTSLLNPTASISVTPQTIVSGSGALRLSAPMPATTGKVAVQLDLSTTYPWLGAGTTNFTSNACTSTTTYSMTARPLACATYGTGTADYRRYYLREYVR